MEIKEGQTVLVNAFSLGMLAESEARLSVREISAETARLMLLQGGGDDGDFFLSAVGHADTAAVFSTLLNLKIPHERATVRLLPGATAIVGQLQGPRLPEGATTLPEGASIKWLAVDVESDAMLKRMRRIRDALNKCKDSDDLEMIANILGVQW